MLDMECAPALIIIASDAAHHGKVVVRPRYCLVFFVIYLFLTYLFLSMLVQLEGAWTV